jgi:hypothetical protein
VGCTYHIPRYTWRRRTWQYGVTSSSWVGIGLGVGKRLLILRKEVLLSKGGTLLQNRAEQMAVDGDSHGAAHNKFNILSAEVDDNVHDTVQKSIAEAVDTVIDVKTAEVKNPSAPKANRKSLKRAERMMRRHQ